MFLWDPGTFLSRTASSGKEMEWNSSAKGGGAFEKVSKKGKSGDRTSTEYPSFGGGRSPGMSKGPLTLKKRGSSPGARKHRKKLSAPL